jgi:hypothetical protein
VRELRRDASTPAAERATSTADFLPIACRLFHRFTNAGQLSTTLIDLRADG